MNPGGCWRRFAMKSTTCCQFSLVVLSSRMELTFNWELDFCQFFFFFFLVASTSASQSAEITRRLQCAQCRLLSLVQEEGQRAPPQAERSKASRRQRRRRRRRSRPPTDSDQSIVAKANRCPSPFAVRRSQLAVRRSPFKLKSKRRDSMRDTRQSSS